MPRYLVTSALPYINGVKHLGNLIGSMLPADCYSRYLRSRGREVLFICATDEHGTPAELAAQDAHLEVSEFCKRAHELQADLCKRFDLSFDYFGRSSSVQNRELTQHFAQKLDEHGYIEERATRQIYSLDDGRFLPDRYVLGTCPHCKYPAARGDQCENCTRMLDPTDLIDPRSAVSGSKRLEVRESRHLYLLQSKLTKELREWIDTRKDWPVLATSIALKWLDEGLQDRCITRDLSWGIPVPRPGFEGKVFYVWFDAPIEYIGATKEWADASPKERDWKSWWWDAKDVHHVQFMAKDNVPFHTIVFPASIIGTGEPWKRADYLKAFNWLNYEGGKFSTSSKRGIFMSDALDILPSDYWRYWLIANAPETGDSDFTWESFSGTVNKDLVGVIGNFVNRIFKFTGARFDSKVPAGGEIGPREQKLFEEFATGIPALESHLDGLSLRKAVQEMRALWVAANTYVSDVEPWKAITTDPPKAAVGVRISLNLIRVLAILSEPFIPDASRRIFEALGLSADERKWPTRSPAEELATLVPGRSFEQMGLLFRRLADEEIAEWSQRFVGSREAAESPAGRH